MGKTTGPTTGADIEILVSNTGGAKPDGESAKRIRSNLQQAFAARPASLDVTMTARSKQRIRDALHQINVNANLAKNASKSLQQQLTQIAKGLSLDVQVTTTQAAGSSSKKSKKNSQNTSTPFEKFDGGSVSTRAMSQSTANITKQRVENLKRETDERIKNSNAVAKQKLETEERVGKLKIEEAQHKKNTAAEKEKTAASRANTAAIRENEAALNAAERAQRREADVLKQAGKTRADSSMSLARFNEYLEKLNPKALLQYRQDISEIQKLLDNGGNGDLDSLTDAQNKIKLFKASMKDLGYEGGNVFSYLEEKIRTFSVYLLSSMAAMSVANIFSNIISSVKELDTAFTDLKIVTGGTNEETKELMSTYNQLAQELGSTTVDVASGATDWLRQGYTGEEAEDLLKQSMTLSIVGNMDAEAATTSLTAALKGLQLQTEDASDVVDKFFAVDMAAATSAENLALALAKTAANAKLAGISLNDVVAQLAVVSETMQESGTITGSTNCLVA